MVSTKLNYMNNEDKTGGKRENPSLLQATGELKVTVGVGSVSIQKDLMKLVETMLIHFPMSIKLLFYNLFFYYHGI